VIFGGNGGSGFGLDRRSLGDTKFHAVGRDDELTTDALNRALIPAEISQRAKFVKEANHIFQAVFGK
jgi:Flp pilus assembly CpaE family ATPase